MCISKVDIWVFFFLLFVLFLTTRTSRKKKEIKIDFICPRYEKTINKAEIQ